MEKRSGGSMISLAEKVNRESTDAKTAAERSALSAEGAARDANTAIGNADTAARNANTAAQDIQTKADRGDFTGTIQIGEVTTGDPGSEASANNSGTGKDAVIDLKIPRGYQGVSMRMAGAWEDGTEYVNDMSYIDLVTYQGSTYGCKRTHTASEETVPIREGNEYWQCIAEKGETGDIENIDTVPIAFEEAEERENIESGDTIPKGLGKIRKWFSDFKQAAFYDVVNNVLQTEPGQKVLDAAVGKYLDDKKFDISRLVANRNITEPGFAMDGKTLVEWLNELNGKLGAANIPSLTTSILDKALELEGVGLYFYRLGGSNYIGDDLPKINYANGSVLILRRAENTIAVFLMGSDNDTPLVMNYYYVNKWLGWQTYVRTSDLGHVDVTMNVTAGYTKISKIEGLNYIPVILRASIQYEGLSVCGSYPDNSWVAVSNTEQNITIRFFKYPV